MFKHWIYTFIFYLNVKYLVAKNIAHILLDYSIKIVSSKKQNPLYIQILIKNIDNLLFGYYVFIKFYAS